MPPAKEFSSKSIYSKTTPNGGNSTLSAKVYHPATNLLPPSPPLSPTGVAPPFGRSNSTNSYTRQNSQNNGRNS